MGEKEKDERACVSHPDATPFDIATPIFPTDYSDWLLLLFYV